MLSLGILLSRAPPAQLQTDCTRTLVAGSSLPFRCLLQEGKKYGAKKNGCGVAVSIGFAPKHRFASKAAFRDDITDLLAECPCRIYVDFVPESFGSKDLCVR